MDCFFSKARFSAEHLSRPLTQLGNCLLNCFDHIAEKLPLLYRTVGTVLYIWSIASYLKRKKKYQEQITEQIYGLLI